MASNKYKKVSFEDLYYEALETIEKKDQEIKYLKAEVKSLTQRCEYLEKHMNEIIDREVDKRTKELQNRINELEAVVAHLKSLLNNDSTNSGTPTSKTPINKNKHIPNSRVKTDRKVGGQAGHAKHALEMFNDDEVTHHIEHYNNTCSVCGTATIKFDKYKIKDELDFEIIVKKKRHYYIEAYCPNCGHVEKISVPRQLKEANQYGTGVQALALTLLNEGFVSINRTKKIIEGLTHGQASPSEGYISKLQKRLYTALEDFDYELKREIIKLKILHWDDTVIMVDTKRACLRFYGNEKLAYYRAHEHKDKAGLDEDGILMSVDKDTVVVHDHCTVNYNKDYEFQNAECCQHLIRDLIKASENTGHEWPKTMINLLVDGNNQRNKHVELDVEWFEINYDQILVEGMKENAADGKIYYAENEKTLINRMTKYKSNYLMWIYNEEIPFTNNVSERSLRGTKTKMKVSGQFKNIANAEYYARIDSYIETGNRHGMEAIYLITRALEGNPVTIEEMKEHGELML